MADEFKGRGKLWTTDPTHELEIRVPASGPGSEPPITVMQRFKDNAQRLGQKVLIVAIHFKWLEDLILEKLV